jgi:hypothetical protein
MLGYTVSNVRRPHRRANHAPPPAESQLLLVTLTRQITTSSPPAKDALYFLGHPGEPADVPYGRIARRDGHAPHPRQGSRYWAPYR